MKTWHEDVREMYEKFGMLDWVNDQIELGRGDKLYKLLEFRLNFLDEELLEARKAFAAENRAEIVDAMIDMCVIAIGTLELFGVDAQRAWEEVHSANMSKRPGVKPGRPNPLGLPDLMKPSGFVSPNHSDNVGALLS